MKFAILVPLILFGCEYSEENIAEEHRGIRTCTSNAGRPDLSFDTKTLKVVRHNYTEPHALRPQGAGNSGTDGIPGSCYFGRYQAQRSGCV